MANNRMLLVCGHCESKFMLAKYYPDPNDWTVCWGAWSTISQTKEGLECRPTAWVMAFQKWIEEHNHGDGDKDPFIGPTHYRLQYESTQEEEK